MENNFPSEKRDMNSPAPQAGITSQPVGVQINQQGYPAQQGYPGQRYPVQQGYPPQQGYGQPLSNYQNVVIVPV